MELFNMIVKLLNNMYNLISLLSSVGLLIIYILYCQVPDPNAHLVHEKFTPICYFGTVSYLLIGH